MLFLTATCLDITTTVVLLGSSATSLAFLARFLNFSLFPPSSGENTPNGVAVHVVGREEPEAEDDEDEDGEEGHGGRLHHPLNALALVQLVNVPNAPVDDRSHCEEGDRGHLFFCILINSQ